MSGLCSKCGATNGNFRCIDCFGEELRCADCTLDIHRRNPTHLIQVSFKVFGRRPTRLIQYIEMERYIFSTDYAKGYGSAHSTGSPRGDLVH
jgi:hypothetical protein